MPARAPALQTGLLLPPSLPLLACMVGFFLLIYVAVVLLRAMGMIVGVLGAASIPGERAVVLPAEIMADMVAMAAAMVVVMAVVMAAVVGVEVVIMEGEAGMAVTVVCCGSCSPVVWTVTDWVKAEVVILAVDVAVVVVMAEAAVDSAEDAEGDAAVGDSTVRISPSSQGRHCPNQSRFLRTGQRPQL